jgi:O-antigen/teichoic acid export membrane protein
MPYALQLAHGDARLPLIISSALLCVFVPLLVILTMRMGALGAALAWLALHCLYLLLGTWLTHRSLLVHLRFRWICIDVAIPLVITACISVGASLAASQLTDRPAFRLCVGLMGIFAAAACCVMVLVQLRDAAGGLLKFVRRRLQPNVSPRL